MNISEVLTNSQKLKALTSYSVEMFNEVLLYFESELENYFEKYTLNGKIRSNKYSPKSNQLPATSDKLFFILYYLKNNPTQEAMAFTFDLSQDMCNKWIHLFSEILNKALIEFKPESNPHRVSNQLSENETYTIDGTERLIQRDTYVQEEFYSGKKSPYGKKFANYK